MLKIVLFGCVVLFARTIAVVICVLSRRKLADPRKNPSLFSKSIDDTHWPSSELKTVIVLGSGGHTTEMLHLVKNLNPNRYGPFILIVAESDTTSLQRVEAYPYPIVRRKDSSKRKIKVVCNATGANEGRINEEEGRFAVYRIPRSREVGQSYWSSILTTTHSFFFAFWLFGFKIQPHLILVNGPGTCVPIAFNAFFFRIVGWMAETKIVFVESFCRVNSLSLTGKMLYLVADMFVVCWEQLRQKVPLTYHVISFAPRNLCKGKGAQNTK